MDGGVLSADSGGTCMPVHSGEDRAMMDSSYWVDLFLCKGGSL